MGPLSDPYASQGGLWVVDPSPVDGGEPQTQKVEFDWPSLASGKEQFHPLGIEIVEPAVEGGERRLLAVNHGPKMSTIELFSLTSSPSSPLLFTARHLHTLNDFPLFGAPNSIAVLPSSSPDVIRFFLSHDHRYTRRNPSLWGKLANLVETVGALPLSRVDLVEVTLPASGSEKDWEMIGRSSTVVKTVAFANGLAPSPDLKTLVVASTTRRELQFYSISDSSASSPSLTLTRTVKVPHLVDNLSILPSSISPSDPNSFTVLAAGHPSYPALLSIAHGLNISVRLPPSVANALGVSSWPGLDFASEKQRGMSWVVSVSHPPLDEEGKAKGGDELKETREAMGGRKEKAEWETVFQSHGRTEEGGFGGSTTAVAGGGEGGEGKWLVVAGLYEEGVKVIREKRV